MDIYKEYIYQLRKISLSDVYLTIQDDVTPKLKHYIHLLCAVKFEDGSYHTYYGEIKKIVNSFMICWAKVIDEAIKVTDKYICCVNKDDLIDMMETTINYNKTKQIEFGRDFLPVKSQLEHEAYDVIEKEYNICMERIYELKNRIERLDKQDKVTLFPKEHFPMSLEKINESFLFTHNYISNLLLCNVDRIRVSLEEIERRIRNNLQTMQEKCTTSINSLLNQLYDKNKEQLTIFRQETRSSLAIAEVQRSMEIIKDKIEDSKHMPMSRLIEEFKYWQSRNTQFNQISNVLKKLNEAEKKILEEEETLNTIPCPEISNLESKCWGETLSSLHENLKVIKDMKVKTGKALLTFFSVTGSDQIIYTDDIGSYYVDEYDHKVYFFDYGLNLFHVDCDGNFVEPKEDQKYYYDNMGRYIIGSDGSKIYQIAPCTSNHNLQNDVFEKLTKDCGHSNREANGCRRRIKDPNDVCFLPLVEEVKLSDLGDSATLDPEVSTYLWESFGHILPRALHDLAMARPKNPVHYLAHKLLFHKYSRSQSDIRALKEEAVKYRAKLFQDKKEEATAASEAWKAKQVKRRKPEESDDVLERFAYDTHIATLDFIKALNFFDD